MFNMMNFQAFIIKKSDPQATLLTPYQLNDFYLPPLLIFCGYDLNI